MIGKKKISAILAILMLTVSFLIVIPLPVSAAPANAKVYLSLFLWKYPNGTKYMDTTYPFDTDIVPYLYYPAYGPLTPFNVTLNYPENGTGMIPQNMMGALPILAVIVTNTSVGGFTMSSWEFGCKWEPEVLGYPVTFYEQGIPAGLPATVFETEYGAGNANYTAGKINVFHGEVSGYKMARNDTLSTTVTRPRVLCYIIPTVVGYGETLLDIASYVKLDDQGIDITPIQANLIDGYFKFRIHEVKLSPTIWTEPPYAAGKTLVVPIPIITTEPVHSWELNITYYGLDEYGNVTTPTISCPSAADVTQGAFLLLSNRTDPHGGNTFSAQVGPGWIWANGTYNVATQYADAWSGATLMAINFTVLSHGTTVLNVTEFSAVDPAGAEITPQSHFDLAEGLRLTVFKFERLVVVSSFFQDTGTSLMSWLHPAHAIGETFNMVLMIPPTYPTSQNVHAWKAGFRFNPRVLNCTGVTEGDYLSSQGGTTWNPKIVIDNTKGEVSNITCTGDAGVANTGSGTLMLFTFKVIDYGRSLIEFTDTDVDPCEAKLLDLAGQEIRNPAGLSIGLSAFEFRAPITVEMSIGSLYKYVTKAKVFNVTLTIDSPEKVYSWMSGLSFNPDMLNCTGVVYGTYITGMDITEINNTLGYVSVGQTFLGAGSATGAGTLATITFEVIDDELPIGPSTLGFTVEWGKQWQTAVTDTNGDPCALATLKDGEVRIIGDVNGDGGIKPSDIDAVVTAKTKVGMEWISEEDALAANPFLDVNGDGHIKPSDIDAVVTLKTKIAMGWPW